MLQNQSGSDNYTALEKQSSFDHRPENWLPKTTKRSPPTGNGSVAGLKRAIFSGRVLRSQRSPQSGAAIHSGRQRPNKISPRFCSGKISSSLLRVEPEVCVHFCSLRLLGSIFWKWTHLLLFRAQLRIASNFFLFCLAFSFEISEVMASWFESLPRFFLFYFLSVLLLASGYVFWWHRIYRFS